MSNLNLRLYAEQFYGLYIPKLNNYLSQSIEKEFFISSFKSGFLSCKSISTKSQIQLSPILFLNSININSLEMKIPDENGQLIIDVEGLKINFLFQEISEKNLIELIIKDKKNLREKFIENIFNKITNNSVKNNFFGGVVFESIANKILSGLIFNIKNVEINIKYKNFEFIFNIGNIKLDHQDIISKIDLKEIKLSLKNIKNGQKENIINKCDINIGLDFKESEEKDDNKEKNYFTQLKIEINNIFFNLSTNIINAIFEFTNLFKIIEQKKIDLRRQKLIQFHKPKIKDKNYFKFLWIYAIKSVIKLRKYFVFDKTNALEICNFAQQKILLNNEDDNIILVNDVNLLKSTKQSIEKRILDSKDSIANKFFSFFSSNNNNPKSLTDEEKASIENYFKEENLIKYIKGELFSEQKEVNSDNVLKKYIKYLDSFKGIIHLNNIEIKLVNNLKLKIDDLYLKKLIFDFVNTNNNIRFQFNILEDCTSNSKENKNLIEKHEINNENKELKNIFSCSFDSFDISNKIQFSIEKDFIEVPENNLFLIICYSKYIFKLIGEGNNVFNSKKENKKNNISYESIINKIYLPFLPSILLKTNNGNKIDIKISNYFWKENVISFQIQIKDSIISILDNYEFVIDLNRGYNLNLDKPVNINIKKAIIEELIMNFKNINNDIFSEKKHKQKILFNFNYSKNFDNLALFNNNIKIIIKEFNFTINDNDYKSSIKLKNINFLFKNKNLSFTLNEFFSEIDLLSLSPIINNIKELKLISSSESFIHYKYNLNDIIKSFKINIKSVNIYLYLSHKSSYITSVINDINSKNAPQSIYIINNTINNILTKYIDINIPNDTIILDSKKIESNMRINSLINIAYKINIDSPVISLAVLLYNYDDIQKLSKYFIELKNIYEINIKNLRFEYIKPTENSGLSIYITNFLKKQENNDIDLLNLEKYNFNYNLDSYRDLIIKVNSKKLDGEIAQRDISYIFFTLFSPDRNSSEEEENPPNLFNRLILDIDLNQVRCDFNLRVDYNYPLFDLFFGNISIKVDINGKIVNKLILSLDQFQINYYGINNNNNFTIENKKPLAIIDSEIEESKCEKSNFPQIEIKKEVGNKFLINVTKISFIFDINIIMSIIYYFKDISIVDLLLNYNENLEENENIIDNIDIQVIISEIQFLFPRNRSYFYFYLNKLDCNYIKEVKGDVKEYQIKVSLNNIESGFLKRKILYTKNEYLLFVLDIKENKNAYLICNSLVNKLFINVSILDLIFIYKLFLNVNKIIKSFKQEGNEITKENEKSSESSNDDSSEDNKSFIFSELKSIISEINIEGIEITFLEEDKNYLDFKSNFKYYYPFFYIGLNKPNIKFEFNRNKEHKYPSINFNSHFDLAINYFNNNFKIWEPLTEEITLKLNYENVFESNKLFDSYTFEINKFTINLSDSYINILLIQLFRYFNKLKTKISSRTNENKILKEIIIKYKISNLSDINFTLHYAAKNYNIKKLDKIYINFDEEEEMENNLNNHIILIPENNQKKILIFPENIGLKKYRICNDKIERDIYIETKIKENKHIEVMIYNSIIIRNKTNYSFKIKFEENNNDSNILILESNSNINFPDNIKRENSFYIYLISDNNNNEENMIKLNIGDILSKLQTKKMCQEILFKSNNIFFSLVAKIKSDNLLFLTIMNKYCIINCLPCSLFISKNINSTNKSEDNDNIEIRKNSLYHIDNASIFTQSHSIFLKIKIQNQYYTSKLSLMRNDTKTKLINFVNSTNDKQLTLQIIIKETYKNKAMIIYSENILNNCSGIGLSIFSQDENNHNYIHDIGNNLYLISSEIKNSNAFVCIKSTKNIFITKYLKYEDFKQMALSGFSLNYEGKKSIYNFEMIIDKNTSDLFCENDVNNFINKVNEKNENQITIYTIIPKYNIINLTKNRINNCMNFMLKNNQKFYLGINIKTLEEIKDKNNYYTFEALPGNSLFTICIKGNIYNVSIKKSEKGGYKNVFVLDNSLKNSQVIVENKTKFEIILKQKTYEKFKQKIKKYEQQILKMYDQTNKYFSAEIDNKLYYFNLNETGHKQLKKNLYLYIENERTPTKILFYSKNITQILIPKSKSLMNLVLQNENNLKIIFNKDKYIKINILLNNINISLISQKKEERKEIVLIFIKDFQSGIKVLASKSHIKYRIKLNTKINSLEVYNLLNNNNLRLCSNSTSPLINIYSELVYEYNKNKITIFDLVNEIGDIKLNLTPAFLQEIYNFVQNIFENIYPYMKKIDNIFLLKNEDNLNKSILNTYRYNYNDSPLMITINNFTLSGIKVRFKLKKEGIESLPKELIDTINYLKYFPFFDIGKETKAILKKIELQGPYKDIKSLYEEIKINIITQLSTEIVIKVLHPSNNDIKDNMKNMIGFDSSKSNFKMDPEKSSRIKYKRNFIGKNKFFKKYDKNLSIAEQNIKNNENLNNKFYIDSCLNFNEEKNIIIFLEDCLVYACENGQNIKIIYYNALKEIKKEKVNKTFFVNITFKKNDVNNENFDKINQEIVIEFKNDIFAEKIYKILYRFSNI